MIPNPQPIVPPPLPVQPPPPPPPPSPPPWKKKYPSIISGIFSFLQCVITFIIIGCEVGSILIDMITATIYVGFWSSLFFTAAWISQAGAACCCRSHGCATYTLIIQIISLFFAACVIGFDSYYIVNPTTCFFPTSTCNASVSYHGVFYTDWNFSNVKIPLIKGQLAAGAVMFVLCLVYVVIYLVTSIRVHKIKPAPISYPPQQYQSPLVPTGPDGMILAPPNSNVRPTRAASPLYHRPMIALDVGDGRTNDLLCPTCSTMMNVTVKKRPPQ